jgi:hypothetical protein
MAASIAGVFWRAARPSDLAYRHTRNPCVYIYIYPPRALRGRGRWQTLVLCLFLAVKRGAGRRDRGGRRAGHWAPVGHLFQTILGAGGDGRALILCRRDHWKSKHPLPTHFPPTSRNQLAKPPAVLSSVPNPSKNVNSSCGQRAGFHNISNLPYIPHPEPLGKRVGRVDDDLGVARDPGAPRDRGHDALGRRGHELSGKNRTHDGLVDEALA